MIPSQGIISTITVFSPVGCMDTLAYLDHNNRAKISVFCLIIIPHTILRTSELKPKMCAGLQIPDSIHLLDWAVKLPLHA